MTTGTAFKIGRKITVIFYVNLHGKYGLNYAEIPVFVAEISLCNVHLEINLVTYVYWTVYHLDS
jgi:hypothetical protein